MSRGNNAVQSQAVTLDHPDKVPLKCFKRDGEAWKYVLITLTLNVYVKRVMLSMTIRCRKMKIMHTHDSSSISFRDVFGIRIL